MLNFPYEEIPGYRFERKNTLSHLQYCAAVSGSTLKAAPHVNAFD
jgi:hypothetical protein